MLSVPRPDIPHQISLLWVSVAAPPSCTLCAITLQCAPLGQAKLKREPHPQLRRASSPDWVCFPHSCTRERAPDTFPEQDSTSQVLLIRNLSKTWWQGLPLFCILKLCQESAKFNHLERRYCAKLHFLPEMVIVHVGTIKILFGNFSQWNLYSHVS